MSDTKPLPTGGVPVQVLVRGGTTSSTHDRRREETKEASERGRERLDRQRRSVAAGDRLTEGGFVASRMHSLRLMDSGNPKLVLYYMNRDGTVRQECVSEILITGTDELFIMVCPKCLERGEPEGLSQMKIQKSHRKFFIDTRRAGEHISLLDPDGKKFHVRICGTVSCDDVIACDSCGNYRVRIENSKVWEV